MTAGLLSFASGKPPFAWQPLKVGGGGFTRDMDIAPDGTMVCKVDVYGAYLWNPTAPSTGNAGGIGVWQSLMTSSRFSPTDPVFSPFLRFQTSGNFYDSMGAWDIRIAPSNSSVMYMEWVGMMYKTTNKGASWVNQTVNAGGTFVQQTAQNGAPNSPQAGPGPTMAIDPQNPNVCWVGNFAGMQFTLDGGTTWSTLSTSKIPLPTGTGNPNPSYGVAFDPQSAFTGGKTQGLYIWSYNNGVYYSSDAGSTFTKLTGGSFTGTMPLQQVRIVVDQFGVAWVCADANSPNVHNFTVHTGTNFTANTWTLSGASANGTPIWSVAPDPASTTSAGQRIITAGNNGYSLNQSTNGGTTWGDVQPQLFNQVAADIPWLATNEQFMSLNGNIKFDPSQSNVLYMPEGIGVWKASPPVTGATGTWSAWNWNSQTAGIESLETTQIITPPGGSVGAVQWDRNWFQPTPGSAGTFPSIYGTWPGSRANNDISQSVIFAGAGADWAGQTPNFIVQYLAAGSGTTGSGGHQPFGSAFSSNGGASWTLFTNQPPGLPPGQGGSAVAVSTTTSMMVVESGLWATTNAGASAWVDVTPAGSTGWETGNHQFNHQLAADKIIANYYVAFAGGKIYHSANTGGAWTTVTPTFSFGSAFGGAWLNSIPNNAGHYFLTNGPSFGATVDTSNIFYRSLDGGATWADVSGTQTVREVWCWGFGAPNGGSYPTIFIYGYVNSVLGVWQSVDNCVSWQMIGDAQFGGLTFDSPNCMSGDMNTPGNVYVGFLGSGYLQYAR